jgi:signal transduction histidine kinase
LSNGRVKKDFVLGPRFLIAVATVAVFCGVAVIYQGVVAHPGYLFYFFLPIAAVAVVLGRLTGTVMAFVAIGVNLVPATWLGLDGLAAFGATGGERAGVFIVWAVFLLATAYVVGLISERGGSLSLMQGLGGRAIRAVEMERRRTGQDIHDGIAQYAAAAFIETEVLADMTAERDPELHQQVKRVKHSLSLLVVEARSMINDLRPPALGPEEFEPTMSKLTRDFQVRTGIVTDLELEGDFSLHTDSVRICLYRTLQEALANADRHSGASAIRIWAKASKGSADLIVSDNGRGFSTEDSTATGPAGHHGLFGMRERADYLGGRLAIKSTPDLGTTVVLHVPKYEGASHAWV